MRHAHCGRVYENKTRHSAETHGNGPCLVLRRNTTQNAKYEMHA